ncbi:hypothetical protein BAE44_0013318 [Dichanthelium oligosanthes]|uniref:No apical meristem-associated C-terminal domain-containing protein n=1 Tax=Dichanthelium oligosanthes TaxID=888268 RepID=A0A1E5VKK0_9POAL|nr:hypothetical protein BAE44_0013318 [Dichanthelium oligosanthes]
MGSMTQCWGTIKREVSRFCGIKNEQDRLNASGRTNDDRLSDAMRVFEALVGHQFSFLHCWVILRGQRKWEDKLKGVQEGWTRPRMPSDPSSTAQATESEEPDSAARPMGQDAAKKRRNPGQSGSETSIACLAMLQQMTTSREAVNQA